ncbi:hypothetical protein AB0F92_20580 [Kitasatospora aureofaciens]|uniref:hypothetical protein n=1 Tax=Kitasatospora aureofaciens TaxID=1894 RepID=UPI0033E21159
MPPTAEEGGNGVSTPPVPDQREPRTYDSPAVMVRLVPSDPKATAQLLVDAMDHRQAVQVAFELLEILKREAEPKHVES